METTTTLRRLRYGCYSDIVQGAGMFWLFIAVQLGMYDLLPIPASVISVFPSAPIMAELAPLTQGELVLITLVTAYGAIWGMRRIDSAITRLREISFNELVNPTQNGA